MRQDITPCTCRLWFFEPRSSEKAYQSDLQATAQSLCCPSQAVGQSVPHTTLKVLNRWVLGCCRRLQHVQCVMLSYALSLHIRTAGSAFVLAIVKLFVLTFLHTWWWCWWTSGTSPCAWGSTNASASAASAKSRSGLLLCIIWIICVAASLLGAVTTFN